MWGISSLRSTVPDLCLVEIEKIEVQKVSKNALYRLGILQSDLAKKGIMADISKIVVSDEESTG